MIDFELKLQTEDILLRPLKSEDIEDFAKLTADKQMWIYFTSDLSDRAELEKWMNDALTQKENRIRLPFTIICKKTGDILGSTSFGNISYHDNRIEIGWTWLGKNYRGKGVNNKIKYLMIRHCFEEQNFLRVECKTDVLNIHARKALLKINMTEEGILRSHTLMTNGRRRDTIYYSVLKSEWPEIKTRNNWGDVK
jgi:RimJ/RimL family protein N-acetyltransferase